MASSMLSLVKLPHRFLAQPIEVVGLQVLRSRAPAGRPFGLRDRPAGGRQPGRHLLGDLGLHRKDVRGRPVPPFGPQVRAAIGLDQLRRHADLLVVFLDRALQHVADIQCLADRPDIDRLAGVGRGGVARHDVQVTVAGQIRDDVFGHPGRQAPRRIVAAKIVERQHGDRGLADSGSRRRWACRWWARPFETTTRGRAP